jgi:hypothetical protein
MSDNNFIDARKYTFAPFPHPLHPEEAGDSGALEIAASKNHPNERYIVKYGYPELGCNEFMYHKVAEAFGLYTQEVKLVVGDRKYHRAAAVTYVPNARLFHLKQSSTGNFNEYFKFEALYVILNESDSHEYYLDGQGRLFKLDNAASFTVEEATILWFEGNPLGHFFIHDIETPLNAVGYNWYGLKYKKFEQEYGQEAIEAYLSIIRNFAEFNETVLHRAYDALDKQYPQALKDYYDRFIQIRKQTCRKFLKEIGK